MFKSITRALFLVALSALLPATALAQSSSGGDGGAALLTSTSTTTTLVGVSVAAGVGITTTVRGKEKKSTAALAHYLDVNRVAIQESLPLGHGEAAQDLAALLGVDASTRGAQWQAVLRENRAALLAIITKESELESEDALAFMAIIEDAMAAKQALATR